MMLLLILLMMVSFQFSHEAEFISPLYVLITLVTDTDADSTGFAQLIQL